MAEQTKSLASLSTSLSPVRQHVKRWDAKKKTIPESTVSIFVCVLLFQKIFTLRRLDTKETRDREREFETWKKRWNVHSFKKGFQTNESLAQLIWLQNSSGEREKKRVCKVWTRVWTFWWVLNIRLIFFDSLYFDE